MGYSQGHSEKIEKEIKPYHLCTRRSRPWIWQRSILNVATVTVQCSYFVLKFMLCALALILLFLAGYMYMYVLADRSDYMRQTSRHTVTDTLLGDLHSTVTSTTYTHTNKHIVLAYHDNPKPSSIHTYAWVRTASVAGTALQRAP